MTLAKQQFEESQIRNASLSLTQTKQECKLICTAEAKTEGKIVPYVIHQGGIVVQGWEGTENGRTPVIDWNPLSSVARSQTRLEAGKNAPVFVFHLKFISALWSHFTLLGLLARSFHYHSPCILRDTANSPSDHHLHELSGLSRPLFCFPTSAIYCMPQQHCVSVGDKNMKGKPEQHINLWGYWNHPTGGNPDELERVRARVNSEILKSPSLLLQSVTHTTNMRNAFSTQAYKHSGLYKPQ